MLLASGLTIFQEFILVVGKGIGTTVESLLIEQLRFEKVRHLRGASLIVVAVQTEILFGLFNAALGNLQLLARFFDIVPVKCIQGVYPPFSAKNPTSVFRKNQLSLQPIYK